MENALIPRSITPALLQRLERFPVVAITGPRQAGKTTLAKVMLSFIQKESMYIDLELPSDLNKLRNAELFLKENQNKLVVIDEVQRMPELFPLLRALVDQHRVPSRFLILGSASPELLRQSSETLAGRITYLELSPFHFQEIDPGDFKLHWLKGGFPPAFLATSEDWTFQWINDFIQTFIERDLPQFGLNAPNQVLRTLLTMLTTVHGDLVNHSLLAKSLGISMPTVKRYLNYFEAAYFIRYLPSWHANVKKRLVKSPKLYFRDSGVFHFLAGIFHFEDLLAHRLVGPSWEGYVIQQILSVLPSSILPFFYRTQDGSELDLILVKGNQPVLAIEVKYSINPFLTKGNRLAIDFIKAPVNLIVAPIEDDYPLKPHIRCCGVGHIYKYLENI